MSTAQLDLGKIDALRRRALAFGALGMVALVIGFVLNRSQFFVSYLEAYVFWLSPSLACLAIVMVANLTGAGWVRPIRPLLEAAYRTLPIMALLFLPIALGGKTLYPWMNPEFVQGDKLLMKKAGYLNIPFFYVRTVFYFVLWTVMAYSLNRWRGEDVTHLEFSARRKVMARSAFGLLLYVLSISFAAIDWVMSLDPYWASSAFGLLLLIGQVLASFSLIVVLTTRFTRFGAMPAVQVKDLHDYGNFMLMAVMFWTYIAVAQALLIWSANLPEELTWYFHRVRNGWEYIMLAIILFHFALPFLLLLQRVVKRNARYLSKLAAFILFIRLVDIFWTVKPNFAKSFHVDWMDLVFPVALGGIWLAAFFSLLCQQPRLAVSASEPQDRPPSEKRKR